MEPLTSIEAATFQFAHASRLDLRQFGLNGFRVRSAVSFTKKMQIVR